MKTLRRIAFAAAGIAALLGVAGCRTAGSPVRGGVVQVQRTEPGAPAGVPPKIVAYMSTDPSDVGASWWLVRADVPFPIPLDQGEVRFVPVGSAAIPPEELCQRYGSELASPAGPPLLRRTDAGYDDPAPCGN